MKWDSPQSREITPKELYLSRRRFLAAAAGVGALALSGEKITELLSPHDARLCRRHAIAGHAQPHQHARREAHAVPGRDHYNNFYEFGTDKDEPAPTRRRLQAAALDGEIDGLVKKPQTFDIDDLLKTGAAGGARLPPALRRGLVDGDSVDRLLAGRR